MRLPWSFAQISTLPLRQTPTQLYVVPKSIPMQGPSIGSSDAPPRRRRTGAAVRRPRGASRAVVVARSALKSALLLRRTMMLWCCLWRMLHAYELVSRCSSCAVVMCLCCTSDDGTLREALLVSVRGYGTCILQSFATIAQHYAIDRASQLQVEPSSSGRRHACVADTHEESTLRFLTGAV